MKAINAIKALYYFLSRVSITDKEIVINLDRHLRIKSDSHLLLDLITFAGNIPPEEVRTFKINNTSNVSNSTSDRRSPVNM